MVEIEQVLVYKEMVAAGLAEAGSSDFRRSGVVKKNEFTQIRHHLGKTQNQMAQLMGTSIKAVQSFEQGWRNIPSHVERQVLFLLTHQLPQSKKSGRCWTIQDCPTDVRKNCPAWEFKLGHLCWFINGTICQGEAQGTWKRKMNLCRKCNVFQSAFEGFTKSKK
jgi:DNA-binding transcriptional regulator YiaG